MIAVSAPSAKPAAHPASASNDLFHFHPQASNPELWRTSVPLIVRIRCERHKGLIATWLAIHWLIILYASNGRRAFGMREIAQEANVGRNELAGPNGYIQRLVALGLLMIVGYEQIPGLKEPRPIYHIDLAELERLSLELTPALLRERHLAPPPRPVSDPYQLALIGMDTPPPADQAPGSAPTGRPAPIASEALAARPPLNVTGSNLGAVAVPRVKPAAPENGTDQAEDGPAMPETRTALVPTEMVIHENGTDRAEDTQRMPENGTDMPASVPVRVDSRTVVPPMRTTMPESGTATLENELELARKRDVEGGRERMIERASERSDPPPALFSQLAAQAAQLVIQTLQHQGLFVAAPQPGASSDAAALTVRTPDHEPPLPEHPDGLWQAVVGTLTRRDQHQLHMLAAEYDRPTDGFGTYWVGRAILIGDRCVSERGQSLSINYLRGMLRRWQREASWGSDREDDLSGSVVLPTNAVEPGARMLTASANPAAPVAAPSGVVTPSSTPTAVIQSPTHTELADQALAAYTTAFGRTPNAVQSAQIQTTVTDLALWNQVLTDWQANGWKEGAVAKMLDRYRNDLAQRNPQPAEPPPSVRVIHYYPGLDLDERERWIRRFHAAHTPAEKRAVLERLEREHPGPSVGDPAPHAHEVEYA